MCSHLWQTAVISTRYKQYQLTCLTNFINVITKKCKPQSTGSLLIFAKTILLVSSRVNSPIQLNSSLEPSNYRYFLTSILLMFIF